MPSSFALRQGRCNIERVIFVSKLSKAHIFAEHLFEHSHFICYDSGYDMILGAMEFFGEAGDRAMVLGVDGMKKYVALAELQPIQRRARKFAPQDWCEDKKKRKLVPGCVVKAPQSYAGSAPVVSQVLFIHQGWVFLQAVEGLVGERAYLVAPGDKCEYVPQQKPGVCPTLSPKKKSDNQEIQ